MERKYYQINEEAARTAHNILSFRDYEQDSKTAEYRKLVEETYQIVDKVSEAKPEQAERAYQLAERFSKKMADNFNKASRIGCMCPSILISGGSNFPVKKKEKQNEAYRKNYKEYEDIMEIRGKIENILYSNEVIKSNDENAIKKLREKLENLEEEQKKMKAVNAYYRKHKNLDGCPELTEEDIKKLKVEMKSDWHYEDKPYATYLLTNNNQNIKRVSNRLKRLEAAKDKGSTQQENEFCKVVENTNIMRLQLIFDGKPSEKVRDILKSNGFRWSPKEGAWQRQLTNNAKYSLKRVLEKLKEQENENAPN